MKKTVVAILLILGSGLVFFIVNAATTTSLSATIHEIIDTQHQIMQETAEKLIQQLESDSLKTEISSTYPGDPTSIWKVAALKGSEVTMVNITVDDARIKYKLHLSGVKKKGQSTEYTQYSIYQQ